MKKNLLNKLWLRVWMIVAIMCTAFTSAWAEDKTITLDYSSFGLTTSYAVKTATVDGFGFTVNQGYKGSGNTIQMNSSKGSGILYNTTAIPGLKSITVNVASGNKTYTITTGTTEKPTANSQTGTATGTYNATSGDEFFQLKVSGASYFSSIVITYEEGGSSSTAVATTTTIDASGITNTDVYEGTEAGSLAAIVEDNDENEVEGATVTWSGSNDKVATVNATTGAVTLVAAGTVTFTATYAGVEGEYKASSDTYEMTVTNSDPNAPGTENNPYTVAEAIAYIGTLGAATSATEVYVSGIISQVDSYNSKYGSITYWISDNGTTEGQMEVYSGLNIGGEQFSAKEDLQVGDIVTVKGYVKMYNTTPEFTQNNQLVSLDRPVVTTPSIDLGDNVINAYAKGTDGVIIVDYKNITTVVAEVFFCDADGNAATYDWIAASINSINNLEYIIDANESTDARTAYMKVHALDDDANDVYSELITINQAGYVAPVAEFATLPFSYEGGKAGIETTAGLTQEGLGNDYSSAPYLKFDGTGDYVVLAFNERPGKLTFDIKGNSFSGSTFTVQTSEDGETYTDLKVYTELGSTQSEEFDNLGENVRYIKWIYTEKSSGNVAFGNIALAAYAEPVPVASITVDPVTVEASAAETDGALGLTYANFTVSGAGDFDVQFYDGEGEEIGAPNWIVVEVAEDNGDYVVSYVIEENASTEARSAYFKVYAMDEDFNLVYSDLVTVNQAGFVAPPTPGEWVETALADLTFADVFVIVGNNGSTYALSNDNGTSKAPDAVEVEVVDNTLSGEIADNIKWTISGNATDGYTFYPYGSYNSWLYCTNANNGVRVGTNDTNNAFTFDGDYLYNTATDRYVGIYNSQDWRCYTAYTGNIADQTVKFYRKLTTSQTVTVSAAGYATLVAAQDLEIPSGVEVYAVEVKGNYALLNQVTAGIPAGEAVVVKADEGEYVFNYATEAVSELVVTNDLIAATAPVKADGTQYVLAKPAENEEVGFYKAKEGSTIAVGKAYLQIAGEAPVKGFTFKFGDDATSINEELRVKSEESSIYNLAGQRVSKMQRGINIVNGKKVLK